MAQAPHLFRSTSTSSVPELCGSESVGIPCFGSGDGDGVLPNWVNSPYLGARFRAANPGGSKGRPESGR